jgi:hypothetical protein
MRISNLILAGYLVTAAALAALSTPTEAQVRTHAHVAGKKEEILAMKTPGGVIYLFPTSTLNCHGMLDAFAETNPDEDGDTVIEHGCWKTDGADVVLLTDEKEGYVFPLSRFEVRRSS